MATKQQLYKTEVKTSSAVGRSNVARIKKELVNAVGTDWESTLQALKSRYPGEKCLTDPTKFLDIAANCLVKQGKIFVRNQFKEQVLLETSSFELYVDPVKKTLEKNLHYAQRQHEKAVERQKRDEQAAQNRRLLNESFIAIRQKDNNWAILRTAKLEKPEYDAYLRKTVNPAFDRSELHDLYGVRDVFCAETRILTYQETRQLNLI